MSSRERQGRERAARRGAPHFHVSAPNFAPDRDEEPVKAAYKTVSTYKEKSAVVGE